MRRIATILLLALVVTGPLNAEDAVELDAFTGLRKTGDWELVRNNCIACHSPKLITQQRGDAAQWLGMIRWMQEKQNLWAFDAEGMNPALVLEDRASHRHLPGRQLSAGGEPAPRCVVDRPDAAEPL